MFSFSLNRLYNHENQGRIKHIWWIEWVSFHQDMIRRTVMNMTERDRIVHENQGSCFRRFKNLVYIILLMVYVQYCIWFIIIDKSFDKNLFSFWVKITLKNQRIVKKLPIQEIREFISQHFVILIIWLWSIISPFLGVVETCYWYF